MLRALNIWEHDKEGKLVRDEEGRRVLLKGARAGQPKTEKDWSADDREYYTRLAPAREDDLAIQRLQHRLAREQLLEAARRVNALDQAAK